MRKSLLGAAILLVLASPAVANFCAVDSVTAATLLLPWAAVTMVGDQPSQTGYTTYLTLTNVAKEAPFIQVTVWDVVGQPRMTFTQVLSGYDTWSVNFRDVLSGHWGAFDTSRSVNAPPNVTPDPAYAFTRKPFEWGPDGRSAHVSVSWIVPPPFQQAEKTSVTPETGCAMPYGDAAGAVAAPLLIQQLRAPLFARQHGGCPGISQVRHDNDWVTTLGTNPLVFFVTVDVVNSCTTLNPSSPAYWNGVASDRNVLVGNVYYVNDEQYFSESYPAVAIEASATQGPSVLGFYQSRTNVEDNREPLPTAFELPYQNEAPIVRSDLLLWKNFAELDNDGTVVDCGGYVYYAWDEDEHSLSAGYNCDPSPCSVLFVDGNQFPFFTQMVPLTSDNFDLPDDYGWMLLVLPPSYDRPFTDPSPGDTTNFSKYMGWAALRTYYQGHSTLTTAWTMANAHCNPAQVLPNLGRTGQ